jgi:hypothetical protein
LLEVAAAVLAAKDPSRLVVVDMVVEAVVVMKLETSTLVVEVLVVITLVDQV